MSGVGGVGGEGGGTGDDTLIVVVLLDGVGGHEVVEAAVVSGVVEHVVVAAGWDWVWRQGLRVYPSGKEVTHFVFHNQT